MRKRLAVVHRVRVRVEEVSGRRNHFVPDGGEEVTDLRRQVAVGHFHVGLGDGPAVVAVVERGVVEAEAANSRAGVAEGLRLLGVRTVEDVDATAEVTPGRAVGDFTDVEQIKNIIVGSQSGAMMYLKDVAEVKMGYEEQESFSRLNGKNVIALNVIKRSGENLINASDKIKEIVEEMKQTDFPANLDVVITGDQSRATRVTLHDLINTIIIGFILVTLILMFFMGATNAIFVAMSTSIVVLCVTIKSSVK